MDSAPPVLVLGARGMLGHTLLRVVHARGLQEWGTVRSEPGAMSGAGREIAGVDASRFDTVRAALDRVRPGIVVNCVGIVKQLEAAKDPVASIEINSLFPHRLARACAEAGARLVHVSTDCVFSGRTGRYSESDIPDPVDLYGRTKLLGELDDSEGLTVRTSIIGHELGTRHGLVEWFLAQEQTVQGYRTAIYSGLPTVVLANVLVDHVFPRPELRGVYHVGSDPISKHDLLQLVAVEYGHPIRVDPANPPRSDRSLDSTRFRRETGWVPPPWPALVAAMHRDHLAYNRPLATGAGPRS